MVIRIGVGGSLQSAASNLGPGLCNIAGANIFVLMTALCIVFETSVCGLDHVAFVMCQFCVKSKASSSVRMTYSQHISELHIT